jgi:hypothetical protein
MKTLCITVLLLFAQLVNGQKTFNKHIGINILGQRAVPEIISMKRTENYLFAPMGITYMQSLKHFKLRAGANYYKFTEEARTRICWDCYFGTGTVEGLEVKAGIQKAILKSKYVSFSGGLDLGYSRRTYKGTYQGGFHGGGYVANEINNTFTLNPYLGLGFMPFNRMLIMFETGIYIDSRRTRRLITDATAKKSEQHLLPLQALTVYWNFK